LTHNVSRIKEDAMENRDTSGKKMVDSSMMKTHHRWASQQRNTQFKHDSISAIAKGKDDRAHQLYEQIQLNNDTSDESLSYPKPSRQGQESATNKTTKNTTFQKEYQQTEKNMLTITPFSDDNLGVSKNDKSEREHSLRQRNQTMLLN